MGSGPARTAIIAAIAVTGAVATLAQQALSAPRGRAMSDRECLARAMYFESNRSAEDGMLAVGTVVANRLRSGRHGSTVCGVVGEKGQFAPGVLSRSMDSKGADRARRVAAEVLNGKRHPGVRDAMFFHTAGLHFGYGNMKYVLVAGGNAFYEKRGQRPLRPDPGVLSAPALAYAQADTAAKTPFEGSFPLRSGKQGDGASQKSGLRVVAVSEPIEASAIPTFGGSARPPVATPDPMANVVVAQAWEVFDYYAALR